MTDTLNDRQVLTFEQDEEEEFKKEPTMFFTVDVTKPSGSSLS